TVYITSIKMRHRHWGGADFCLSIYFGIMLVYHFFVGTCKEHTAYRESSDVLGLFNSCFLQQRQTVAASPYKYKITHMVFSFTCILILHFHLPFVVIQLLQIFNAVVVIHFYILFFKQGEQLT